MPKVRIPSCIHCGNNIYDLDTDKCPNCEEDPFREEPPTISTEELIELDLEDELFDPIGVR